MTKQWLRKCVVKIGIGSDQFDTADLRVRFKVVRATSQRLHSADIIITNLSQQSSNRIVKEGTSISLEAGYEEGYGLLFKGQTIQRAAGRESPTDTYLRIIAQTGDQANNEAFISKTLAAGHTFRDQVDAVLEVLKPYGVTAGAIADFGAQVMPGARVLFGAARDVLRDISTSTGSSWWIENDKLNVVKNDKALPGEAFVLNSSTGLIGRAQQQIDGIMARCLLNPKLKPGALVKIDQSSIDLAPFGLNVSDQLKNEFMKEMVATDGFYKIIAQEDHGDTRGGPWYTDLVCERADGKGTVPLNVGQRNITSQIEG